MAVFLPSPKPISIPNGKFELDTDHWLFPNMRFAMYPGSKGSGLFHEDLITHKIFERINTPTNATFKRDSRGGYLTSLIDNAGADYPEINLGLNANLQNLSEITILCGIRRTAEQTGNWGRIISRSNGSTGDDWAATIRDGGGDLNALAFRIEGDYLLSSTTLVLDQYYDAAFTYKAFDRRIFLDGIQDVNDTLNAGGLPHDQPVALLANPTSANRGLNGDVYYVIVLDRALTPGEVKAFTDNPYQILNPKFPSIYYNTFEIPDIDPAFIPLGIGPSSTIAKLILLGFSTNDTGAVTASGAATSGLAIGSGEGITSIAAIGSPSSELAIGDGSAIVSIDALGSPSSELAIGTGFAITSIDAAGAPSSELAIGDGEGVVSVLASGNAISSLSIGDGEAVVTGPVSASGSPSSELAIGSGAGITSISSSGDAISELSLGAGDAIVSVDASGNPTSELAVGDGEGITSILSSGSPSSELSIGSGASIVSILASGAVISELAIGDGTATASELVTAIGAAISEAAIGSGAANVIGPILAIGSPTSESAVGDGEALVSVAAIGAVISELAVATGFASVFEFITAIGAVQSSPAIGEGFVVVFESDFVPHSVLVKIDIDPTLNIKVTVQPTLNVDVKIEPTINAKIEIN